LEKKQKWEREVISDKENFRTWLRQPNLPVIGLTVYVHINLVANPG